MDTNEAIVNETEILMNRTADRLTLVYVRCDEVIVEGRRRSKPPRIDSIATSLKLDLLQPIAITPEKRLIVGERRLAAAMTAGEEFIPAIVVHSLNSQYELLLAKVVENSDLPSYSDLADLAEDLLPIAREAARWRRAHRNDDSELSERFSASGTALDQVAKLLNLSRPTLIKIIKVVAAAREDEKRFSDLLETLDTDRKVDPVYLELLRRKGTLKEKPRVPEEIDGVDLHTDKKGNLKIRIRADQSDMISKLKTYLTELAIGDRRCRSAEF